jgi:simple sugar transport system permease protein
MDSSWIDAAFLTTWLAASVRLAGPVLLAALGEVFAERAGVLNVGIEGTILFGALAAYLGTTATGMPLVGLLAALAAGLLAGSLLGWMYVTARASQVVVGIVFNLLALGTVSFVYRWVTDAGLGGGAVELLAPVQWPGLSDLPLVGPVLFAQPPLLYATLLLAALASWVLYRTRLGLSLRAVGENPRAAQAAGISVVAMRYTGVLLSGAAAGLAGAYLMLCEVGMFRDNIVSGQGFIALAIVILGRWSPGRVVAAALLFGAADALQLSLQLRGWPIPAQLLLALPYVLTLLAISGVFGRAARQPGALMQPYEP